tara:strand:+ start:25 stop:531 length:507 start_codon:yes stop_codon:yes gene_type:complete
MVGAGCMTDPNVLGGDKYGLKFLFASGDTRIVHLFRAAGMGAGSNADEFPDELLSLQEANSGLEGSVYAVPVGKVFYMLAFTCYSESANDLMLSIQRNSTINNQALGDNLYQTNVDFSNSAAGGTDARHFVVGGLQFNAGDYVTPYGLAGAGNSGRWGFQCWGVECDV